MALIMGHCYQFGEFTVDSDQKVLLRNGIPLALAPKVFDTLLFLVDNNGRLVEKDELIKQLWPDTFVEESNLTFNIQQVRKILGDNAREPRFIETVARRGYRFIAEVTKTQPNTAPTAKSEKQNAAEFRPAYVRPYLPVILATAMLFVGAVVFTSWFFKSRPQVAGSLVPLLNEPFKSEKFGSGGFVRAVITPDGKYVAYTVETQNRESIWLRQLETSENIQIVPPTDNQYLGITPSRDGNSLYFVRRARTDPPISELYRVMTFGGIPVKIAQDTEGTVSLSPDDKEISFIRCKYQNEDFCSLMLIDRDGKNERKLLTRRRPIRLAAVHYSPDGRSIAFASGESSSGGSNFRVMLLDLSTGVERQISETFFDITGLKWLPTGNELLLAAKQNHDGRLRIWHVSTVTGEARPLTKDAVDYINFSLSRAADKLLATCTSNTFHLFTGKIDDLSNARDLAVARYGITVGPDGKIVYEGNDGDLWMIDSDGGERRQLTSSPFSDVSPRLSQDGRYIFFNSTRSGTAQVWRMNADGSDQVQITSREGGNPKYVTADGRLVYFESGLHKTLWRVSTSGGDGSEVSNVKMSFPAFSSDGKLVAYFFRDESDNRLKIGVMLLDTGLVIKTFDLTNASHRQGRIAWLPDSKSFYYVTMKGPESLLWRQSLYGANVPQLVANLGDEEIGDLALSPGDGSLAFIRGRWVREAVLIEGLK